MTLAYDKPALVLSQGTANERDLVRALQRDLRALGYLKAGIDGDFGLGTAAAVRALQYDLLNNNGTSTGADGRAPVAVVEFNDDGNGGRRVNEVSGVVDQPLAQCLAAMLSDQRVPQLPSASDPVEQNQAAMAAISALVSTTAPTPFIAVIVKEENSEHHFNVPRQGDTDTFVLLGLDRNDAANDDHITSRGYGIGQYTLFHHPPRANEVADYIADPRRNVQNAYGELRETFDKFVAGPADFADDRTAEHPLLPLRLCKYSPGDQRYMRDCRACAMAVRKVEIVRGSPCYPGAAISYQPSRYHPSARYSGVPDRADFACDWPYAARRYNGSGNDSFHYQTQVLLGLLAPSADAGS